MRNRLNKRTWRQGDRRNWDNENRKRGCAKKKKKKKKKKKPGGEETNEDKIKEKKMLDEQNLTPETFTWCNLLKDSQSPEALSSLPDSSDQGQEAAKSTCLWAEGICTTWTQVAMIEPRSTETTQAADYTTEPHPTKMETRRTNPADTKVGWDWCNRVELTTPAWRKAYGGRCCHCAPEWARDEVTPERELNAEWASQVSELTKNGRIFHSYFSKYIPKTPQAQADCLGCHQSSRRDKRRGSQWAKIQFIPQTHTIWPI